MKRNVRVVYYTPRFERRYGKLTASQKLHAEKKEAVFRADPFSPELRTHKLKGKLEGRWAFSVGPDLRILFRFLDGDEVLFLTIGPHDLVY